MMAALVLTCKARKIANENLLTQISTLSVGTMLSTWPTLTHEAQFSEVKITCCQ